jgi:hypothetical protein
MEMFVLEDELLCEESLACRVFASSVESALYLVDREWGQYLCPLYRVDSTSVVKNGSRRAS